MYRTTSVQIYGTVQGTIWWPFGLLCEKRFHLSIGPGPFQREWTTLRDLLLHVTSDGDFQSASVTRACLKITRQQPAPGRMGIARERARYLEFDVTNAPAAIADLFAGEKLICSDEED